MNKGIIFVLTVFDFAKAIKLADAFSHIQYERFRDEKVVQNFKFIWDITVTLFLVRRQLRSIA